MAYLCELLANPEQYAHIVSWTPNGLRWEFKVHDTKAYPLPISNTTHAYVIVIVFTDICQHPEPPFREAGRLNLTPSSLLHQPGIYFQKSYLQIARALKSFEQKDFEGHVTLKKVKDKRNHFQFFPAASDDDGQ